MISEGHAKARMAGLDVVKKAIEYVRVQFLGQEPRRPTPPASRNVSYTQSLFNRFAMPSAREGYSNPTPTDILGLLGRAIQTYGDTSSPSQTANPTGSSTLIPPNLDGQDRDDFVNTQREQLRNLLSAFDAEASSSTSGMRTRSHTPREPISRKPYLSPPGDGYMHRSRSESEFEEIIYETMPDPDQYRPRPAHPAKRESWSNWIWGNYGERDSAAEASERDE
jgi:hypothetical protein